MFQRLCAPVPDDGHGRHMVGNKLATMPVTGQATAIHVIKDDQRHRDRWGSAAA
jgi:hypothetical protein